MNSSSHCLFSTMNSSAMLLIKSSFKAVKERKEDFLNNGWEKLRCYWKMEVRLDVALCQYSLKPEYNFIIHQYPKQRTCCLHFFFCWTQVPQKHGGQTMLQSVVHHLQLCLFCGTQTYVHLLLTSAVQRDFCFYKSFSNFIKLWGLTTWNKNH